MQTARLGNERGGQNFWLEVLNQAANFVVVADEEEFQHTCVLAKQQAQFQSGAAFKDVLSQLSDGDSGMCVGTAKAIGNDLKCRLDAGKIRIAQVFERGPEARAEQDRGFRHVSICL